MGFVAGVPRAVRAPSLVPAQLVVGKCSLLALRCATGVLWSPSEAFSVGNVFMNAGVTMDGVCQNVFSPFT